MRVSDTRPGLDPHMGLLTWAHPGHHVRANNDDGRTSRDDENAPPARLSWALGYFRLARPVWRLGSIKRRLVGFRGCWTMGGWPRMTRDHPNTPLLARPDRSKHGCECVIDIASSRLRAIYLFSLQQPTRSKPALTGYNRQSQPDPNFVPRQPMSLPSPMFSVDRVRAPINQSIRAGLRSPEILSPIVWKLNFTLHVQQAARKQARTRLIPPPTHSIQPPTVRTSIIHGIQTPTTPRSARGGPDGAVCRLDGLLSGAPPDHRGPCPPPSSGGGGGSSQAAAGGECAERDRVARGLHGQGKKDGGVLILELDCWSWGLVSR